VFVHGTNHKGAVAEAKIVASAITLGVPVLKPVSEHSRYDIVFDIGRRFFRVQCKWGSVAPSGDVIHVATKRCRWTGRGYVHVAYVEDEIDLLAVYCGQLDQCFLLPASRIAGQKTIYLRLRAPANAQRACITLAAEHEFSGAVAQLGERPAGSREVRGSSPLSSTPSETPVHNIGAHEFREHFGYWMEVAAAGAGVVVSRHGRPHVRVTAASPDGQASVPRLLPVGEPPPALSLGDN
jgi:antitoxin (DNA-binding transcriptional repressor) of toxin-antitoxin stability system